MPLSHHVELKSGEILHEEFTKNNWEAAMRSDVVARHWGHDPLSCHDPVCAHWASLRKIGWLLTPRQHAWADLADNSWVGDRGVLIVSVGRPSLIPSDIDQCLEPGSTRQELPVRVEFRPPPPPIVWPPDSELQAWQLSAMTTMSRFDAVQVLRPPWKEEPKKEKVVLFNQKGQGLLF